MDMFLSVLMLVVLTLTGVGCAQAAIVFVLIRKSKGTIYDSRFCNRTGPYEHNH